MSRLSVSVVDADPKHRKTILLFDGAELRAFSGAELGVQLVTVSPTIATRLVLRSWKE